MSLSTSRRLELTIDGRTYVVEIEDLSAATVTVLVNGQRYQVNVSEARAPVEAGAEEMPAASPVSAPAPRRARRKAPVVPVAGSANEILAPMPGDILDISVAPGDRVTSGQQLCALEAMKMKSAIRSPRDGVIAAVEVAEGQAVQHGDVLITFE